MPLIASHPVREVARRCIRRLGYELHRTDILPVGRCPFRDVATIFAAAQQIVAFDVGANTGQTTASLLGLSRHDVYVHAFELGPSSFDTLTRHVGDRSRVMLNTDGEHGYGVPTVDW